MPRASPLITAFNAGEFSPEMAGRVDIAKYPNSCKRVENFLPMVQGPVKRRGGFRYVAEVKDSSKRAWMVRFEFNTAQAYVLEFGDRYIRFFANHGQVVVSGVAAYNGATAYVVGDLVVSAGVNYYCIAATTGNAPPNATYWYALTGAIYEIPSPYLLADLTNSDGTFALRFVESADIIYLTHTRYPTRKLSRLAATTWVLSTLLATGGPFKTENTTATTVYASGITGSVTLFASAAIFSASHVGSLFRLQPQDFSRVPPWEPYAEIANGTGNSALGLRRRSLGLNYICTSTYAITGGASPTNSIRTGTDKPIHTSGLARDGSGIAMNGVAELVGVNWQFTDPGYGIVKITAYTSPTQVTATVVAASSTGIAQLPYFCTVPTGAAAYAGGTTYTVDVFVTYGGHTYRSLKAPNLGHQPDISPDYWVQEDTFPTKRWAFCDWSDVEGWPSHVAFFRERLVFGRKQRIWMSVAGDYENFSKLDDLGQVTADMAIVVDLQSTQVNDMLWLETFSPSIEALMVGTAGSEFVVKSQTEQAAFGPDNVTAAMVSTYGSRNMQPRRIGNVILYALRSGLRMRDLNYDFYSSNDNSNDQSLLAEHMLQPGINQIEYLQSPYSMLWAMRSDGGLVAMTYNKEQYPEPPHGGWHRHPVGGGGIVEALAQIPAPDQSRDDLWAIAKFTVNGVTKRYIGFMEKEYLTGTDPEDAFLVDWGLTLDNTAQYITGNPACTLTVPAGALTSGATNVSFIAGAAIFAPGDVGREIHHRYSVVQSDLSIRWYTAKCLITHYTSALQVEGTVTAAFTEAATLASTDWRLTVTSISGLGHLEGKTVDVCTQGASHPQRVVTGGAITLAVASSKTHIGVPMPARLQTMRMNAGSADGTSQGKQTSISKATVRLLDTLGLRYGHDFADMLEVSFRSPGHAMDNAVPLFTGDKPIDWLADWNTDPWLCFEQADPLPCTIVALMPQVVANDKG